MKILKKTTGVNTKLSSLNEGFTRVKAFIAIAEDEPTIGKANASKVTIDQLLNKKVPSNIVCALEGRGKRKETIFSKEVVFTKADESPSKTVPEITSNSESKCDNQEPLPPFPKLSWAEPISTSADVIPPADLT
ncbi:hypothetical protein Tco_1531169 [Tanacetum coccineum]